VCAPGLEEWCATEVGALGVPIRRTFRGGVEFSASDRQLYAANLWLRTATRVVVRVARYMAATAAELTATASQVPWSEWVPEGSTPVVRVSSTSSRLSHTGLVAERLAEVAGTGDAPGPLLIARLIHDRVTLSIDSSGAPLHQRGWRTDGGKAPLRETLAAAVILASGWDRSGPLLDPLCGSGTLAIEAALSAAGRPPGEGRRFAFQDWPSFQPGTWASVTGDAGPGRPAATRPVIVATDRDAGAVATARANAERAGVADRITTAQASVSELGRAELVGAGAGPGWLVTNPPYGKRVAGGDLRDLYARLGDVARARLPGWTAALLVADPGLAGQTRLRLEERLRTSNGGLAVHLLVGRIPERDGPGRDLPGRDGPGRDLPGRDGPGRDLPGG